MVRKLETYSLECSCCPSDNKDKIAYILYPMDILADWIEPATTKYNTTIVVVTGMDWQNVFSPWPAKGVPEGSPDFKGKSSEFLELLLHNVIPQVEQELDFSNAPERTLFGVSMSGLFALWQWMLCDTFCNIACLSGSFWFEGFVDWMRNRQIPSKNGKAYFLLGEQEAKSKVKAFATVADNTKEIISLLDSADIVTEFQSVPGNHYSDPIARLDRAFTALYCGIHPE